MGVRTLHLALLYQTGLVGFLAYAAAIAWIFGHGIRIIREGGRPAQIMIPMLVGLCGLLIANGTNPYPESLTPCGHSSCL